MDSRAVYRNAMRCYRLARKSQDVAQFMAAVSLVRSLTGVWDIPHEVNLAALTNQRTTFARRPEYRSAVVNRTAVDFGAQPKTRVVITRPGRLHVYRSMTLFCRRTRSSH